MTIFIKNMQKGDRGYTLLFAVLVTSIVLSVAISILSISRKEFVLSTSARESQFAFYAADSGLECASYFDVVNPQHQFNSTTSAATIICGAMSATKSVSPTYTEAGPLSTTTFTFNFPTTSALSGTACSNVVVTKARTVIPANGSSSARTRSDTTIVASGYNVGWNPGPSDCSASNPKKVERQLKLTR